MEGESNPDSQRLLDEDHQENLKYRKWVLIPVLFCFVFGGGMTLYIVPEYIQTTIKQSYQGNDTVTNESCTSGLEKKIINDHVQQESAQWNVYLALAAYIPAIFTNLILGSYSDIIGRKLLLIISLSGMLVKIASVMVVTKLELDFYYLLVGNLIEGLTGSFTTLLAVSFSYISDLTKEGNHRTLFIVLLELVLALSLTVSSITVGYFIKLTGFFYPSLAGTAVSFLGVLIAAIGLPETLARNRYSTEDTCVTEASPCSILSRTLKNIWTLYFGGPKGITIKYILLMLAFTFVCIPQFGGFDTLYQLGSPFCWSATKIGWYGALKTSLSSTVGLFSAYLLKKFIENESVAAVGTVSMILALVVEGLATTSLMLYFVPVIGFLSSLPIPMIRSLMSHMTSSHLQGALFAGIGAVETLCVLLGNVTTNAVYSATLKIMNGFVFLVSATYAFVALILIVSFMIVKRCRRDEPMLLQEVHIADEKDVEPVDLNVPD